MDNKALNKAFSQLSTALIADACLDLGVSIYVARIGIQPLEKSWRVRLLAKKDVSYMEEGHAT